MQEKSKTPRSRREATRRSADAGTRKLPPSNRPEKAVLEGVRSLATPPGEPYNDVLLRRR